MAVKAVIIRDGKLLALKCRDEEGFWHMLPGGGQEWGETAHEALQRECREEIGCEVRVGRLLYARDYIGKNHEFAAVDHGHQVELMFQCELLSEPSPGSCPDTKQVGFEWLELATLPGSRLYLRILERLLQNEPSDSAAYLVMSIDRQSGRIPFGSFAT
jgi:ADP-ribose pyrophosphatase YjhB (NUDIX family)